MCMGVAQVQPKEMLYPRGKHVCMYVHKWAVLTDVQKESKTTKQSNSKHTQSHSANLLLRAFEGCNGYEFQITSNNNT